MHTIIVRRIILIINQLVCCIRHVKVHVVYIMSMLASLQESMNCTYPLHAQYRVLQIHIAISNTMNIVVRGRRYPAH